MRSLSANVLIYRILRNQKRQRSSLDFDQRKKKEASKQKWAMERSHIGFLLPSSEVNLFVPCWPHHVTTCILYLPLPPSPLLSSALHVASSDYEVNFEIIIKKTNEAKRGKRKGERERGKKKEVVGSPRPRRVATLAEACSQIKAATLLKTLGRPLSGDSSDNGSTSKRHESLFSLSSLSRLYIYLVPFNPYQS